MADFVVVVLSGKEFRCPMPSFMETGPKYCAQYLGVRFTVNVRRTSKPFFFNEPLASSSSSRSCCAMLI